MRVALIIFCFLLIGKLNAQTQHFLSQNSFELGAIVQLNEDVFDLNIANKTNEDIFILRISTPAHYDVKYTSKLIKAQQAELLRFKINPKKKGKLKEQIQLYFSSNQDPTSIEILADVEEIPKNNLQSCPNFKQGTAAVNFQERHEKQKAAEIKSYFVELVDQIRLQSFNNVEEKNEIEELQEEVVVNQIVTNTTAELEENIPDEQKEIEDTPKSLPNSLSENYRPNQVIFLIDASTSMREKGKMDLLKKAMIHLLKPLREKDYLSIVTYSGEAETLLEPTSGIQKLEIENSINNIPADGSTNAVKGIREAIQVGMSNFIPNGNNMIFLATDGAFDIGSRNTRTRKLIEESSNKGLIISVIGIKNEKWTNKSLKEITELGKGSFLTINKEEEVKEVLEDMKSRSLK